MRVFVTGGTGFVGRYVVRYLMERGHKVVLGVRSPEKARALFGDKAEVYSVDFSDKASLREVLSLSKIEAVVHLIGILFENKRRGLTFEKVHYLYSLNLYQTMKELGIERAVHMSALGTHDEAPSRYHQTKRWAEKHLMESGIRYTIFRPSLILGPEQKLFYDMDSITRVIPIVALPGGGNYRFQPVDVRDVAQCFVASLEKPETENSIYELCGTKQVSFRELLQDIFSRWNRRVLMVPLPKFLMYYMGKVVELFVQPPPFSSDQILMMWKDNVCGILGDAQSDGVQKVLEKEPVPYEESLSWALEEYKKIISS
ncbi:NADH dehydrogenase [Hydrogenivirga caldilitoris]|uniref:NADH dehydrogenase n=1 Tax=Hydrogenivirga caldilitoris TaxID=246264 RepID=A0A497XT12_9AQUI|nr:complex I NDUFA9 subunit family protein [Hydrogenivirga caldilitoris]RLJ70053.1 NADH dehydrogenase [Hydrogenivirga caldilitoris]